MRGGAMKEGGMLRIVYRYWDGGQREQGVYHEERVFMDNEKRWGLCNKHRN